MQDARNFQFSSDYIAPVFIQKYEFSISATGSEEYKTHTINHGFDFIPLIIGQWSFQSNFGVSYGLGYTETRDRRYHQYVETDERAISATLINDSGDGVTIYYRLYALAPPGYLGSMPSIFDSSNYILNSDFSYPKMIEDGFVNITSHNDTTIYHNLGYKPVVRSWVRLPFEDAFEIMYGAMYTGSSADSGMFIDNNKVVWKGLAVGQELYYQIFGEEI